MIQSIFQPDLGSVPGKLQEEKISNPNWVVEKLKKTTSKLCSRETMSSILFRRIPFLAWFPNYNPRDSFKDVVAGVTLGIYNIPQGMAYSVLASLPPVYGLYAGFFPPLIYAFFGSSRHTSIGVFSITCLMVAHARLHILPDNEHGIPADSYDGIEDLTPVDVVVTLSFLTGIIQILMAFFQLNCLTSYMSDAVISGFTWGAALQAAVSQIATILGVKIAKGDAEFLKMFYYLYDIAISIPSANPATVIISTVSIAFLLISKECAAKYWKYKSFPMPTELALLLGGTVFSTCVNVHKRWDVKIIADVPTGMPSPRLPRFELFSPLFSSAISIAVVAFVITVSMGKLFGRKHKYTIDANQELCALGLAGVFSSFFSVFPTSCSLSRTLVNEASGAVSQLSGVAAAVITLTVILWIGPLLSALPMCILSCIVLVALRSLFCKVTEIPALWRVSRIDFMIWVVTAVAVLVVNIIPGLAVGVLFAVVTTILRTQFPEKEELQDNSGCEKGKISMGDFPAGPILQYHAPIIFTNVENFKNFVLEKAKRCGTENCSDEQSDSGSLEMKNIIVDASTWPYIDSMAVEAIKELHSELSSMNVRLVLVNMKNSFLRKFKAAGVFEVFSPDSFWPSVDETLFENRVTRTETETTIIAE